MEAANFCIAPVAFHLMTINGIKPMKWVSSKNGIDDDSKSIQ
jgi:hypothetical protein